MSASRRPRLAAACGLMAAALLAACAMPGREAPGAALPEVLARQGAPSARYPLADGGERLQYSEMPAGSAVYNLDFDRQGRLRSVDQPLTPLGLEQIRVGAWTDDDVRRTFGPPMEITRVARFTGQVWTYRFLEMNNRRLVHIHVDPQGVVRRILYTDEFSGRDTPLRD